MWDYTLRASGEHYSLCTFTTATDPPPEPRCHAKRNHFFRTTEGEDIRFRLWGCKESLFDWWGDPSDEGSRGMLGRLVPNWRPVRGAPLIVQRLLWAPLRVAILLTMRVPRNRTCLLVDCWCHAPQVCFTYHPVFIFLNALGTYMIFFWGWGKLNVSVRVKSE